MTIKNDDLALSYFEIMIENIIFKPVNQTSVENVQLDFCIICKKTGAYYLFLAPTVKSVFILILEKYKNYFKKCVPLLVKP